MRRLTLLIVVLICVGYVVVPAGFANAATETEQLQSQISAQQGQLANIDAEIAKYTAELNKVGAEKGTLQTALKKLDLERKKVLADIAYTQKRISITDLEIKRLSGAITDTETQIETQQQGIAENLRRLREVDDTTLFGQFLQQSTLGDFWVATDRLAQVRVSVADMARKLAEQRTNLSDKRSTQADRKNDLLALASQFDDQNKVLSNTQQEKNNLLSQTKNKESEYQKLIAAKKAARAQVESEMRAYESRLKYILDPSTIPPAGTAVFAWPIAHPIVTQYFGGTEFAKQNASVYAGRPYHPGIDIGAARGTQILAPADGTVRAVGNTDTAAGCWAWGKWTLIDHDNGLATLYAHQDQQIVVPGQRVTRGSVIGYTGSTGYATGPHLHFTVYVKAAVQVQTFGATACASVPRPTAPTSAYLDPILYLPKI